METQYEIAQQINYRKDDFAAWQIGRYGNRYAEYREAFENPIDPDNLPDFPLYITIETSYKCNLRCVTCLHGEYCRDVKKELDRKYSGRIMKMDVMDAVLDQASKYELPSIGLNWLGEPTMAKNIDARIRKCVEAGIMDVLMSSNGTLLSEELSERIIRAGLTHMLFSVDAATERTYKSIRMRGDYGKVDKNITDFIRIRHRLNGGVYPKTRASLVPSRLNQDEIKPFIEKYSKLVDYVEIQPFCNFYGRLDDLVPDEAEKVPFKCQEVFDKLTIDINGDVHPCCSLYGRDITLGNARRDDLRDIFLNHPVLKKLRKEALRGEFSMKPCRICQDSMYKMGKV